MPHGLRRADYWLYPWQIRAVQLIAERTHATPSAVVRDLLTAALPESLRPKPFHTTELPRGGDPNVPAVPETRGEPDPILKPATPPEPVQ